MQCKSFSHFFNKKYWQISDINVSNFNNTLTNHVVSFEQPGPGFLLFFSAVASKLFTAEILRASCPSNDDDRLHINQKELDDQPLDASFLLSESQIEATSTPLELLTGASQANEVSEVPPGGASESVGMSDSENLTAEVQRLAPRSQQSFYCDICHKKFGA